MLIRKSVRLGENIDNYLSTNVSERHEYSKELAENSYEEPTIIEEMENSDSLDIHKDQNGDFYISLS